MLPENSKINNYYFLDVFIYLLPISMILGNAAININCLIIIINFFVNIFLKKNFNFSKKFKDYFLLAIFFVFFSFNIYFSVDQKASLVSFIGIVKYILITVAILYCCRNINLFLHKFSRFTLLVLIFVSLDTLFQFFYGVDIFGYGIMDAHGRRLSGPFGDETIVGSYLSKFVLLSLLCFGREKKFYAIFYLIFIVAVVFLSNERSASIMCLFSIFLYLILTPHFNLKKKLLNISSLFLLIIMLFSFNTQLKDHFIKRSFQQFGIMGNSLKGDYAHKSFWDSRWGAHFLTAIEINRNNMILGSGLHTYRVECANQKYEKINSVRFEERCNTHPHNIYLEIFSELGSLFFIFFIIFNIYFLFKLFKVYFFNKEYQQEASIIISLYFLLFFPVQTTGSLFSTWVGVIYWITIALCLNLFNKPNKN
jgi:O-antigen ligase